MSCIRNIGQWTDHRVEQLFKVASYHTQPIQKNHQHGNRQCVETSKAQKEDFFTGQYKWCYSLDNKI